MQTRKEGANDISSKQNPEEANDYKEQVHLNGVEIRARNKILPQDFSKRFKISSLKAAKNSVSKPVNYQTELSIQQKFLTRCATPQS